MDRWGDILIADKSVEWRQVYGSSTHPSNGSRIPGGLQLAESILFFNINS
jgi:hypothetical protein